ncbi:hypothetical protein ACCAA_400045 [Candidatus Accumulibacter aalborgensis]|uniref:Uncharacterized protein n=1 Tax=Candidatus Accumulibacter aalborgensis TaxID=1860102 RepID=A0A1A8XRS4_9PROT|nr:hypothetical protein ACCAA_400045 [Candidatus Accumulibacter aalborgensis]
MSNQIRCRLRWHVRRGFQVDIRVFPAGSENIRSHTRGVWHDARHDFAMAGDGDFLTGLGGGKERGEFGFGLGDLNGTHDGPQNMTTWSYYTAMVRCQSAFARDHCFWMDGHWLMRRGEEKY